MLETSKNLSKAESLFFLKKNEKKIGIKVPEFIYFTKKKYLTNPNKIFLKINKKFKNKKIIIRSSSLSEDNLSQSNAGKFKSFKNLEIQNQIIDKYIHKIIKEYDNDKDQVIIQEFVSKPDFSGVIFTRNINNNSPYYIINYDNSGSTDLVTSGNYNPLMRTITIKKTTKRYQRFENELRKIEKIEKIYQNDRLDIEFCKKKNFLYIFQCRPLKEINKIDDKKFNESLINIEKKIRKIMKKVPNLYGKTTLFTNMSDWNPAEMIGVRPFPLSLSLYSELITDEIWSKQRKNYGYQDVRPNPLMVNFAGSPYIDIRVDFNSFLPEKLAPKIKEKAINYYLKKIKKYPSLQDKIEFELIETCYDFDTKKNLKVFLSSREADNYARALKKITNDLLTKNYLNIELNKIKILEKKIKVIKNSNLSHIQKIFYYINDCKKYGTLPFSGVARLAFIATKILRSLLSEKILNEKDVETFYKSIPTVSKQIQYRLSNIKDSKSKKLFLNLYGHLRPSTYSISSKSYEENFDEYFLKKIKKIKSKNEIFKISKLKQNEIDSIFKKHGIKQNCRQFLKFASRAISARESVKLIFSKSINEVFLSLIELSKEVKISRPDLEFISIKNLLYYFNSVEVEKLKNLLIEEIKKNKKDLEYLNLIEFPEVILSEKDFYCHEQKSRKGNYITDRVINGEVQLLKNVKNFSLLDNKIILIESADPGYDFIFSYKLKGLITKYGGANSHMSIRCLELGLPAIIGIGEKDYNLISKKNFILIDSKQKNFRIIN